MRILVSPLDWGLGHASRLSRVVSRLLSEGHEVIIAGSGRSLELLKGDFPTIKSIELKSFSPWFFRRLPQWLAISLQVPTFIYYMYQERRDTRRIVEKYGVDMIVSDNRYGVRSKDCKSVIITHQLSPHITSWCPRWIERFFGRCIGRLLNKFDEIWIPDIREYPDGIAGDLTKPSSNLKKKIVNIGILSRLNKDVETLPYRIDHLAVISGPEPQRTLFEEQITKDFATLSGRRVIVSGKTEEGENSTTIDENGIEMISHCSTEYLSQLIKSSEHIVCRSGYSTIMDLMEMGKRGYVVPTPGQAEQEYLANRIKMFGFFTYIDKYPK